MKIGASMYLPPPYGVDAQVGALEDFLRARGLPIPRFCRDVVEQIVARSHARG